MALSDRIQEHVQRLPPSLQAEVLDFVEYLTIKAEKEALERERRDWSSLSLSSAMRGMEDEDASVYTPSDLTVTFS
jgi:hypothetical protein